MQVEETNVANALGEHGGHGVSVLAGELVELEEEGLGLGDLKVVREGALLNEVEEAGAGIEVGHEGGRRLVDYLGGDVLLELAHIPDR